MSCVRWQKEASASLLQSSFLFLLVKVIGVRCECLILSRFCIDLNGFKCISFVKLFNISFSLFKGLKNSM